MCLKPPSFLRIALRFVILILNIQIKLFTIIYKGKETSSNITKQSEIVSLDFRFDYVYQ